MEEVQFPIPRRIVGIPGVTKIFHILPTCYGNRHADEANENNYIACLFITHTAYSDSSFHCPNCLLQLKLKKSKKVAFLYIESKV